MPRNGSGTYTLPSGNPVSSGTIISTTWANPTCEDLGAALTQSLAKDGQTTPTANLPMGGFHHVSASDPTLRNQYLSMGMGQDGRHIRATITGGTNDLIGTMLGGMSAYFAGQAIVFKPLADNTGPMTLSINSIGAKAILSSIGTPLQAGDVLSANYQIVLYNDSLDAFQFQGSVASVVGSIFEQDTTTGWERPANGVYPDTTVASVSSVTIPAGTGWVMPPGSSDVTSRVKVEWVSQAVTIASLVTRSYTIIAIDSTGTLVQITDSVSPSALRDYISIAAVSHPNGAVLSAQSRPNILADDGYLMKDMVFPLNNINIGGTRVSGNIATPLFIDIAGGTLLSIGWDPNTAKNPNRRVVAPITAASFYTLAGIGTIAGPVQGAPITNYDPSGGGVVTPLPGVITATIHRLYFLGSELWWVYGQQTYADLTTAASNLFVDRSDFIPPPRLANATLIAEFITQKNCLDLNDRTTCFIINKGGFDYTIGGAGSIDEAPADGLTYCRRNAAWSRGVAVSGDTMTGKLTVSGGAVDELLKVDGTGNPNVAVYKSGARVGYVIANTAGNLQINTDVGKNFLIAPEGNTAMTFFANGHGTIGASQADYATFAVSAANGRFLFDPTPSTSGYGYQMQLDDTGCLFNAQSASRGHRWAINGTESFRVNISGNVSIGTQTDSGHKLSVAGPARVLGGATDSLLLGSDSASNTTVTDATNKSGRISTPHYLSAEQPAAGLFVQSIASANEVYLGGGTATQNAATTVRFHTALDNITTVGTERMRITPAGSVLMGTTTDSGEKLQVSGVARLFGVAGGYAAKLSMDDRSFRKSDATNALEFVNAANTTITHSFGDTGTTQFLGTVVTQDNISSTANDTYITTSNPNGGSSFGTSASGTYILGQTTSGGTFEESWMTAARNGAVSLFHNGAAKLATTAAGADVSGVLNAYDRANTSQRVANEQRVIAKATSFVLTDADVNNILSLDATLTLTLADIGYNGALITLLVNLGATVTIDVGTQALRWYQGGSELSGNRTILASSVVTLCRTSVGNWKIWGDQGLT